MTKPSIIKLIGRGNVYSFEAGAFDDPMSPLIRAEETTLSAELIECGPRYTNRMLST
jgi:hypothetical protein